MVLLVQLQKGRILQKHGYLKGSMVEPLLWNDVKTDDDDDDDDDDEWFLCYG